MELIKVAIADADTLLVEDLKRIFAAERDLLVVGEAADDIEAAVLVERRKPDVLLLDLNLPRQGAVPVLLEANQKKMPTKVLSLSLFPARESILDTAKAGAWGYVLKRNAPSTLMQAIRRIYKGEIWVDRQLNCAETFLEFARQTWFCDANGSENGVAGTLSKRELEILAMIANGLTNQEVSTRLCISQGTVKVHLTHIFNKLNVKNRTQAALLAVQSYQRESGGRIGSKESRTLSLLHNAVSLRQIQVVPR